MYSFNFHAVYKYWADSVNICIAIMYFYSIFDATEEVFPI